MEKSDDNNDKVVSDAISIKSNSRPRNDSESSTTEDGSKRQRTNQHFVVSGSGMVGASPPKFVTLEEIMQAANGLSNMALVHQIAVDNEFKLNPVELPENSIQKTVADTMKRAFWDLLREDLAKTPPNYSHALRLLEDIKQGLFSVLLPQHTKIKQTIDEVLDENLIRQQVDAGTLDFKNYANYIINVMSKLCAPIRDEKIKQLAQTEDAVESFKGILETLDLMALDMANFTLNVARPNIIAQSVEYEREKFAEYLKIKPDGLEKTRLWLLRHYEPPAEEINKNERSAKVKAITTEVLNKAYVELLHLQNEEDFPETLSLDHERLLELQVRIQGLAIIGAIILVTTSNVICLQVDAAFKEELKQQIVILLQDVNLKDKTMVTEALLAITELVKKQVNEALKKTQNPTLNPQQEGNLAGQITDIGRTDHSVRQLIQQRVLNFLQQIISSPTAAPEKLPPGLSTLQKELFSIAGNFLRIVSHNRSVFSQYYIDIVDGFIVPKVETTSQ